MVMIRPELVAELEMRGRDARPRIRQFAAMLAHPEFADFFDKNFSTWEDCKHAITMLKMGEHLKSAIQEATGEDVSGNQLAAAMERVIHNADSRQYMVAQMRTFMSDDADIRRLEALD